MKGQNQSDERRVSEVLRVLPWVGQQQEKWREWRREQAVTIELLVQLFKPIDKGIL